MFSSLFSHLSSLFTRKSWQQAWARGDDASLGGGAGRATLTNAAAQSAWVFRCLQLIAGPIRSVPLEWYALSGPQQQMELNDPDLAAFWARPAVTSGGVRLSFGDFIELSCHWINLKGQAAWILDDTWLAARGEKSPLILARADRLTALMQGDTLLGWQFIDGRGRGYNLLPQQVIRPRILNPFDDTCGLAPLDAAWIAASADHAAGVFSRNISASNGDQGVYVISKGGVLTEEQKQQIISQLRQKATLSKRGDYRPAFLTGDVQIEDPKVRTVDSAFLEGRNFSRDEIATAFGVPCSMLQRMDSYSIGAASDRFRLIDETCIPMAQRLAEAIAQVERLRTARDLMPEFDWDEHTVLSQVRNEQLKAAAEVWKTGVPWDVLNEAMDLGLDAFPGSNVSWLPMGLEAKGQITATPGAPSMEAPEDSPDDSPRALMRQNMKTLDGLVQQLEAAAKPPASASKGCAGTLVRSDKRLALWKAHMAARRPSEKLFASKFTKVMMSARAEVLANLDATEKHLAGVRQRGVLDLLFNLATFTAELVSEIGKAHRSALAEATGQFLLEIARPDDPWTMPDQAALAFLRSRENLMKDVAQEVYSDINATLEEGLAAGESQAKLKARVRAAFNDASDARAQTIAATETGAAYGKARAEAMQGLGITHKQWLSAQDDRVRATHRRIDGQVVRIDEAFRVPLDGGGEDLMDHPCGEGGSPENVINCRCVHVPLMPDDVPQGEV